MISSLTTCAGDVRTRGDTDVIAAFHCLAAVLLYQLTVANAFNQNEGASAPVDIVFRNPDVARAIVEERLRRWISWNSVK